MSTGLMVGLVFGVVGIIVIVRMYFEHKEKMFELEKRLKDNANS